MGNKSNIIQFNYKELEGKNFSEFTSISLVKLCRSHSSIKITHSLIDIVSHFCRSVGILNKLRDLVSGPRDRVLKLI